LSVSGSIMTNKYAEGYPGHRYYGGCQYYDVVENLARDRATEIFGAEHANVQPHSGSQANMAVEFAVLEPGDTILSMSLAAGGHLSHGAPKSFSGMFYHVVHYGVNRETEQIDMDEVREQARTHRPKLIIVGASAYPRAIDFGAFRQVADEVGARILVDIAHVAGLVAAGLHPDPVPHADFVTLTTHKTMRGPRGGIILCRAEHAERIDALVFPGIQGGPLMHTVAGKAVALKEAMTPRFTEYQHRILHNCQALLDRMKQGGYRIVSDGSDNHMFLVDLGSRGLSGVEASHLLEEAGIIVNKNLIPFDPKPVTQTSGIRIGTPAVSTRGMAEPEMKQIAEWIDNVLSNPDDRDLRKRIRDGVAELCARFPLHPDL
ncbi:MAG: serine hydroxymethyltransferase, partial [Planctomycetota bacterium]